jgi:4-hydroxy-tetrahydrodipicolinate synthase
MKRIEGVNVAAITPRDKQGDADFGASLELIDFLCEKGVRGIAMLGSTGEFASLSFDERQRLMYLVVKRSRVPVLAGVGHPTLDGAVALGREACAAGAAGLLLMPPYFFRYDQDDLREFYLQFSAQVGPNVPVYLYNIPFFTSELQAETAGIKDSSGSMEYFGKLKALRETQPFTLLVGNDVIFAKGRAAGANGVVSGCGCAVPELMLAIDRAIAAGDDKGVEALDAMLQEFIGWLNRFPTPVGVRAAVSWRGVKTGAMSVPLPGAKVRLLEEFQAWFKGWLPEVQRETARA